MTQETFKGTIETAYGTKLDKPLPFSGTFDAYENLSEIPDKERPTDTEIVKFVNAGRKAAARQSAMNAALDTAGIKKPTLADKDVQIATMVKVLLAAGKSQAEAESLAATLIG